MSRNTFEPDEPLPDIEVDEPELTVEEQTQRDRRELLATLQDKQLKRGYSATRQLMIDNLEKAITAGEG